MRFHTQNLSERNGRVAGSILRHGRCWFDLIHTHWRFEWLLFKAAGIGLTLDLADYDEDAIGGHLALGFCALYWGFAYRPLRRLMERVTSRDKLPRTYEIRDGEGKVSTGSYWSTNGRTIGIRWFEGYLWIDLWYDPMESRSSDPRWWHIAICPVDVLFGRAHYEQRELTKERVIVPMPEGGYAATVEIFESTWKRPRWPGFWRRMVRSTITPDIPIPFPGKGENAWDCGEDSTHSMTGAYETAFEAAMALSKSVMKDRVRHGGWNYRPEALTAS